MACFSMAHLVFRSVPTETVRTCYILHSINKSKSKSSNTTKYGTGQMCRMGNVLV